MQEVANPAEGAAWVNWDTNLALDVALGVDADVICEAYGLQYPQLRRILELESFKKKLEGVQEQLEKDGGAFKMKARLQAEEYLKTAYAMVQSPHTDPKVRRDLITSTVRWAGFDQGGRGSQEGEASGFKVVINLGSNGRTIEGETVDE